MHRAGRALHRAALPLRPLQQLAAPPARLGAIVRQVASFQVEADLQGDMSGLALALLELLKMLLLLDVLVYARCRVAVQQHALAIRTVFEAVGYVDCALAVASFRQRHATCVPHFGPAAEGIQLQAGYHPLVPGCVPSRPDPGRAGRTAHRLEHGGQNHLYAHAGRECPAGLRRQLRARPPPTAPLWPGAHQPHPGRQPAHGQELLSGRSRNHAAAAAGLRRGPRQLPAAAG
ncbi:MAG: hypothetical protein WKG07_39270 [Hymenobacter sp.]